MMFPLYSMPKTQKDFEEFEVSLR